MTISFDASLLVSYYQSRQSSGALAAAAATAKAASKVPTAPWSAAKPASMSQLAASVLAGAKFVEPSAAKLDTPGAPADYRELFALHQGLSALEGLATQAADPALEAGRRKEIAARFAAGLSEVSAFLASSPFDKLSVARGATAASVSSGAAVKRETATYTTGAVASGSIDAPVEGLGGDQFSVTFALPNHGSKQVDFDLSKVTGPLNLPNVVSYLNDQLAAAGVSSRFAVQRTPGKPETVQAGGQTVTLRSAPDSFALQLKGSATEVPSFSAPQTAPAVYLAQTVGPGAGVSREIVKLAPESADAEKLFGRTLPPVITGVRSTVTGPDGSLYVLADGTGSVSGQTLKGKQDVVLLRYDSAGQLAYARSLGAAATASGVALAVSPDGKRVAVAGEVTGALGDDGGADATVADSFVTVFDAEGVEQWTRRRGAVAEDGASAVAFGADGAVYVAGRTRSALPGATAQGGQDAYLQGFTAKGAPTFTTQFGTGGSDRAVGLVTTADGAVVTASVEDGRGVLRRFEPPFTPGAPASVVRDLGDLGGGELLGVGLDADGSLRIAGSARGGLQLGEASAGFAGGKAVFAAAMSADLHAAASDRVAWWSPGADASSTAMTVSGGQVYVAGSTKASGSAEDGSQGFAVALDPLSGLASWSQTFAGSGGTSSPTALAVDPGGASVLDRLGLPRGALDYADATDLVSATALRPGDGFRIAVGGGAARTVTVDAGDTLTDLAAKINRATGFAAAAKVVQVGGFDRLSLAPATTGVALTLSAGPPGADALKALGLAETVITTPATGAKAAKSYALNLAGDFDLSSATSAKGAVARVSTAVTLVRQAWSELASAATATAKPGKTGGTVPAHLTKQIANYQAALARLGG